MLIEIGDFYALLAAVAFSFSSAMIKRLNIIGNSFQLNFLRTLIGALIFPIHLAILGRFNEISLLPGLIILYLALSVIFNIVLGDSAFFESQNKLGIKIATPLVNTYPFFTILFAVILLDETVNSALLIGGIFVIFGVIMLSLDKIASETSFVEDNNLDENIENQLKLSEEARKTKIIGLVLILFAIICYTAGIIFTTIATRNIGPILANSIRLPIGALGIFVLATSMDQKGKTKSKSVGWKQFIRGVKNSSKTEKLIILMSGVLGTYISSLFLVLALQEIGASRSTILFSTGPFFTLPIALFWLKENVGLKTLTGTSLTVIGLWIILG